jgi:hypothetical protein
VRSHLGAEKLSKEWSERTALEPQLERMEYDFTAISRVGEVDLRASPSIFLPPTELVDAGQADALLEFLFGVRGPAKNPAL